MAKRNLALERYKKRIAKRLEDLIPLFQKVANGDFSPEINIPKKEDELSPLIITLSMLLDDLRFLDKENKRKTEELERGKAELEVKVKERTKELTELTKNLEEKVVERTKDLQQKIQEMERFQKILIGRELKMIELKKEIKSLKGDVPEGNNYEQKY